MRAQSLPVLGEGAVRMLSGIGAEVEAAVVAAVSVEDRCLLPKGWEICFIYPVSGDHSYVCMMQR